METNREETVTLAVKNKTAFCTALVKHREKKENYFPSHSKIWYRLFGTDLRKLSLRVTFQSHIRLEGMETGTPWLSQNGTVVKYNLEKGQTVYEFTQRSQCLLAPSWGDCEIMAANVALVRY
jgi:hypothetical protein